MNLSKSLSLTKSFKNLFAFTNDWDVRGFLSKLSKSFMLVIALMPLAGLLLGIGSTLESNITSGFGHAIGLIMNDIGGILFNNLGVMFCVALAIGFSKGSGVCGFISVYMYLIFNITQFALISIQNGGSPDVNNVNSTFNILFWHNVGISALGQNIGILSFQTSVVGGILVGSITVWMFNKFRYIHFNKYFAMFSFFEGERFVPIIGLFIMIIVTLLTLLVWPGISIALTWFGSASATWPVGLDSFAFGYMERAFVPFGLHHAFYSPLWWTAAGGEITPNMQFYQNGAWHYFGEWQSSHGQSPHSVTGDQSIWIALNELGIHFNASWRDYLGHHVDINPGRFLQGKYPFMVFGLQGAGLAMILLAKKQNRKVTAGIIGSAMLTILITGVTEPLEFTFLFLAPFLFWGFHSFMAGLSFMLLNILGAHIGMTFSGGLLDLIIYGIIPANLGTNWWWAVVVGVFYFPIYFFVFYFYIKWKNIMTPGRGDDPISLLNKDDVRTAKKAMKQDKMTLASLVVDGLGGISNIDNVDNCASRLRVTIKDRQKVNEAILKSTGTFGVMYSKNEVQVIYGQKAVYIKGIVEQYLNSSLTKPNSQKIQTN